MIPKFRRRGRLQVQGACGGLGSHRAAYGHGATVTPVDPGTQARRRRRSGPGPGDRATVTPTVSPSDKAAADSPSQSGSLAGRAALPGGPPVVLALGLRASVGVTVRSVA
eukprot:746099-Hanusia_phi.AAC.2